LNCGWGVDNGTGGNWKVKPSAKMPAATISASDVICVNAFRNDKGESKQLIEKQMGPNALAVFQLI
jgi:hypothetical protein